MRVTFPRLADHQRAYAVIERDDGVVYQLFGGTAGPGLPHDIRHLIVERELRISDGIWGAIAAGVVYDEHAAPERTPAAARRGPVGRAQADAAEPGDAGGTARQPGRGGRGAR